MSSPKPASQRRAVVRKPQGRILRNGVFNLSRKGIRGSFDPYHSLLSMTWPRFMAILCGVYMGMNLLFAGAYLLCGPQALRGASGLDWEHRVHDAFFFSVHTLATIGYGALSPGNLAANILVTIEAFAGLLGLALATGLLFSRFSRPTARVLFSRNAIVAKRQGVPSLMFRMANERMNQIVKAEVNVVVSLPETTLEGERTRVFRDLKLRRSQSPFFALTWTVIHPIDDESPLYGLTQEDLRELEAEIFVSFMGVDDIFSQAIHTRHSYTSEDLVWNHQFEDMLSPLPDGRLEIDLEKLHEMKPGPALASS